MSFIVKNLIMIDNKIYLGGIFKVKHLGLIHINSKIHEQIHNILGNIFNISIYDENQKGYYFSGELIDELINTMTEDDNNIYFHIFNYNYIISEQGFNKYLIH